MKFSNALLFIVVTGAAACSSEASPTPPAPTTPANALSGGATTAFDATKGAYSNQASNLIGDRIDAFNFGHSIFDRNWVTAPATTEDMDGLGPLFNQRSCSACHARDGRAPPFDLQGNLLGMLFRISVPGKDAHGGPLGDPIYGGQVRPLGILGVPGDGTPHVTYEAVPGAFGDGTPFSLQKPHYTVDGWGSGAPSTDLLIGPRVGPITIGLGLLEAIPESAILANVHTNDPDGVVGRPNHVWDVVKNATSVGRFGWKANVPTVFQQTAGAFVGDMGITSTPFPDETCTPTMTACMSATSGGKPEITDDKLSAVAFYMRTLAVPARRSLTDPVAMHGEDLFKSFGCASCHATTFVTATLDGVPEVENQTIHPYTDLLLHDMGGDLSDNRPDYEATGSEWRTPPLWGIGLLQTVNGHELLMHDARARGLVEAILWHGGEGMASRERFRNANATDRDALIAFLRSL